MKGKWIVWAIAVVAAFVAWGGHASGAPRGKALEKIIAAQERHTDALLGIPGVVGTAAGLDGVIVMIERDEVGKKLPKNLDEVPVLAKTTGVIKALADATARFDRPVPIGVSTGNAGECSAGTIACRVTDGANVYALSNNHVFALENDAPIGSDILQPGRYDTGCAIDPADVIGTLYGFEPIKFRGLTRNKVDAAIGLCSMASLGVATPADGYGTPQSSIVAASLGQAVQKYGRTTGLTKGTVTGLNATVRVQYTSGNALFIEQVIVESGSGFILAGDSGSLLVSDPGRNPTGLLFAGNGTGSLAVANPIGPVLNCFGVTVDDRPAVDTTDIAVASLSAPASAVQGAAVDVAVAVQNVGTLDVSTGITVTLTDEADAVTIGTQTIAGGLAPGASTTLHYSWDTTGASLGDHTLTASHDFADDSAANDAASRVVTVTVTEPTTEVTVTAIAPDSVQAGGSVEVTITGSGFAAGASVALQNGQGPDPSASNVSVVGSGTITATISTKTGGPGRDRFWDVRVTNSDGSTGVLAGAFTVMP